MKKIKWILVVMVLTGLSFSCNQSNTEENNENDKTDTLAVNSNKVVAIDFNKLKSNDVFDLDGKIVKISGLVDHICIHGGKRLMLVGENPVERVEVLAGNHPPFTEDVVGTDIEVTGKLVTEKIDSIYLANWEKEVKQKSIEGDKTVETKHIEGNGEHKQGEGEGQKDIAEELAKIQQLRNEINTNGKGYISNFSIEFESMKSVE